MLLSSVLLITWVFSIFVNVTEHVSRGTACLTCVCWDFVLGRVEGNSQEIWKWSGSEWRCRSCTQWTSVTYSQSFTCPNSCSHACTNNSTSSTGESCCTETNKNSLQIIIQGGRECHEWELCSLSHREITAVESLLQKGWIASSGFVIGFFLVFVLLFNVPLKAFLIGRCSTTFISVVSHQC